MLQKIKQWLISSGILATEKECLIEAIKHHEQALAASYRSVDFHRAVLAQLARQLNEELHKDPRHAR